MTIVTPHHQATSPHHSLRLLALAAAILTLDLLLILPNHPDAVTLRALTMLPLELPPLLLALLLAPGPWGRRLALMGGVALAAVSLLKVLDFATYLSFARPFDLVLDGHLLVAAWHLARGSLGAAVSAAALLGIGLGLGAIGWLGYWAMGRVASARDHARQQRAMLLVSVLLLAGFGIGEAVKHLTPWSSRTAAFSSRVLVQHGRRTVDSLDNLRRFRLEIMQNAHAGTPSPARLQGLAGRDVLLMFVESYGRTALDNPRYAAATRAALTELQRAVDSTGLAARSGWLDSPIQGGQSWLAHATLLAGLTIDNQFRYRTLLASRHDSLIQDFDEAGWDTVSVMPAITMLWPEGTVLGFDRIYNAAALGYRGLPFNWVTMPDQYTLEQLYRRELAPADRPPLFAKVALISSHAPWTPIPPLLDWETLGDGRVFDPHARAGDPPAVVWRDRERVREQFGKSIDYVLRALAGFTGTRLGGERLMIVVGDHQPAPLVTGPDAGLQVPVHIIGPGAVLARLDDWHWTAGTTPAPDAPVWPMAAFRDRLLDAFAGVEGATVAMRRRHPGFGSVSAIPPHAKMY